MSPDFQSLVTQLQRLNAATWWVAHAGQWLIIWAVVAAALVPAVVAKYRSKPLPTFSMSMRRGGSALQVSAILVALCTLLHFLDVRLLPPDQRGSVSSGIFGHLSGAVNALVNVPAELRAAVAAVTIAVSCGLLALFGWAVAAIFGRAAKKAETLQLIAETSGDYVRAELQRQHAALLRRLRVLEQRAGGQTTS
jgi:hypothetical protein